MISNNSSTPVFCWLNTADSDGGKTFIQEGVPPLTWANTQDRYNYKSAFFFNCHVSLSTSSDLSNNFTISTVDGDDFYYFFHFESSPTGHFRVKLKAYSSPELFTEYTLLVPKSDFVSGRNIMSAFIDYNPQGDESKTADVRVFVNGKSFSEIESTSTSTTPMLGGTMAVSSYFSPSHFGNILIISVLQQAESLTPGGTGLGLADYDDGYRIINQLALLHGRYPKFLGHMGEKAGDSMMKRTITGARHEYKKFITTGNYYMSGPLEGAMSRNVIYFSSEREGSETANKFSGKKFLLSGTSTPLDFIYDPDSLAITNETMALIKSNLEIEYKAEAARIAKEREQKRAKEKQKNKG